jgi:prepilin-type N-terminal cleavage/methylation domain-containing protein
MKSPHLLKSSIRKAKHRAFTMVELMVALLLSAIVLLAVYFVFISNTEQYYRQEQIVQMQESMRFALEHIKTDLRNAGRLTVVNGTLQNTDPGFCRPQANLTALRLFDDETAGSRPDFPNIVTEHANNIRPDRLRLLVDASGATPLLTARVEGRVVKFLAADRQPTRDARALVGAEAEARFTRDFQAGHYLFVSALDAKASDLIPIADVDFDANGAQVTLTREPCLPAGTCDGRCNANPVELVEYALVADGDDAVRTALERRVISAANGQPIEGSRLILAEYAVDLQFWGTYDARLNAAAPPSIPADPRPSDDIGNWPAAASEDAVLNVRPERVRALNVLLATRTPRSDETFTVAVPVGAAADRTWFKLDDGATTGHARVATLVSEVETPNIYRGM